MNRTLNVIRMQLVNRQTYIWLPLIILAGSFAITVLIYGILSGAGIDEPKYGGGAQAPLWYFLFVGIYALTLSFPFSQAMSVTRREFFLGTLATAVLTAAILAVVFVGGGLVESATNGWGLNGYFFYLPWIWEGGPAGAGLFFFALTLMVFVIGFGAATVYKRFGALGLTLVLFALGFLLVALVWLFTRLEAWIAVFTWFATQGAVGLSSWTLLLTAAIAVLSFLALRRAVP